VKTGWPNAQEKTNLAEFSKEDYGSKEIVLSFMMMMMMMMMIYQFVRNRKSEKI
jgi:hypothetical protein